MSEEKINMQEFAKIFTDEIEEHKNNFPAGWEEILVDMVIRNLAEGDDPDGYDFVHSKTKPKGLRVIGCDDVKSGTGAAECYQENPLKREFTKEEVAEFKTFLPKYCSYLWSDKDNVAVQTSIWKGLRPWLVAKPGWKGPVDELPSEVHFTASNGLKVMSLTSEDQIKTEGRHLTHCVGRKGMPYLADFKTGNKKFYSLHSLEGLPLITIEQRVSDNQVLQMKGVKNRLPGCGCGTANISKMNEVVALREWLAFAGVSESTVGDLKGGIRAMSTLSKADGNDIVDDGG